MSFFCTFLRDPGTTWGYPGTIWVILGAFPLKLSEKSFFARF
ncbi:hypothetical protein T11_108 [Trichinella zimbabwensis]|uniref:Uncharacterized protein n=1 Tax=Trichinella zimbabwensis TaxID=268475 RepID=A0A0V1GA69_9BILA|nr:hypothetical protein T11_108 [Trichinella zimbabwensis]